MKTAKSGCMVSIYTGIYTNIVYAAKIIKKGEVYQGFKLLEKRFVKEVNADCLYFEHEKSGARLF